MKSRKGRVCLHHGLSEFPEYRAWQTARLRCTSPTNAAYPDYGGRGIRMCEEWINNPAAFIGHVGARPTPKHELDRIDNDGHYEPGNVRWVTRSQNCRNRRSNHVIEYRGESRPLVEWCQVLNLDIVAISKRINEGMSVERAFTQPVRKKIPGGKPKPKCVDCGRQVHRVRCKSCENRRRIHVKKLAAIVRANYFDQATEERAA